MLLLNIVLHRIFLGIFQLGGFFGFFHIITRMHKSASAICALVLYFGINGLVDYISLAQRTNIVNPTNIRLTIINIIVWGVVLIGYIGIGANFITEKNTANHQKQAISQIVENGQPVAATAPETNKKDTKTVLIKSTWQLFGIITLVHLVVMFILASVLSGGEVFDAIPLLVLIPIILGFVFGLIELVCGSIWGVSVLRWSILLGCGLIFPAICYGAMALFAIAMGSRNI